MRKIDKTKGVKRPTKKLFDEKIKTVFTMPTKPDFIKPIQRKNKTLTTKQYELLLKKIKIIGINDDDYDIEDKTPLLNEYIEAIQALNHIEKAISEYKENILKKAKEIKKVEENI